MKNVFYVQLQPVFLYEIQFDNSTFILWSDLPISKNLIDFSLFVL